MFTSNVSKIPCNKTMLAWVNFRLNIFVFYCFCKQLIFCGPFGYFVVEMKIHIKLGVPLNITITIRFLYITNEFTGNIHTWIRDSVFVIQKWLK